jgi:hypothetical protein
VFSIKTNPFLIELCFTTIYCELHSQTYLVISPISYFMTHFYCLVAKATVPDFHYNKTRRPWICNKIIHVNYAILGQFFRVLVTFEPGRSLLTVRYHKLFDDLLYFCFSKWKGVSYFSFDSVLGRKNVSLLNLSTLVA